MSLIAAMGVEKADQRRWKRIAMIGALLLVTGLAHWVSPTNSANLHWLHIALRKFFVVPIVLAAVWFEMRGALVAVAVATVLYVPHVFLQWAGRHSENINQLGEMVTLWLTAVISGFFVRSERQALTRAVETHRGSLMALVAALDAREHETERHSERVMAYAVQLGRRLAMSPQELRLVRLTALLHDVGKIGVPDHVLLKRGSLDKSEWSLMQRHPETALRILRSVPSLREAARVVYCHHERYDGKGYPRGLKGTEIPFVARVFAVADTFDALTSDRPYRKRLDCEAARELIRKEAGKALDPEVVDAFLSVSCSQWDLAAKSVEGEPDS
ncbi:MAG: HD-GYP domain-containing protein [Planctomycetota bacterium]|jgi:HD-GYP domain-containing protein (c-di-GMP phosphodiesterase class II)